ncbi:hypothetical protein C4580_00155 [Candidatus Woesearchaeota archaeon]|nr:MAG: hypothetical protein C4580_00155 [Candidatus Woesearchaeota archaeon]
MWWVLFILLAACASPTAQVVLPIAEGHTVNLSDFEVPLNETGRARAEFRSLLLSLDDGAEGFPRRDLYAQKMGELGVNGIIAVLTDINPTCHDEAHDLGKVIFARTGEIGSALAICADSCYSGCMHGVMFEAFSSVANESGHIKIEKILPALPTFCFSDRIGYKPGDCAHGVGHALMFLSGYDVNESVASCAAFNDKPMEYYCATGAYMEYVNRLDAIDAQFEKNIFFPCDVSPYPAACFRYKMVPVLRRETGAKGLSGLHEVVKNCEALEGFARLGCFHGFGNAHLTHVAFGVFSASDVCSFGSEEDRYVCVEGLIERLAKYEPEAAGTACASLNGTLRAVCEEGRAGNMYRLDKDFTYYIPEWSPVNRSSETLK